MKRRGPRFLRRRARALPHRRRKSQSPSPAPMRMWRAGATCRRPRAAVSRRGRQLLLACGGRAQSGDTAQRFHPTRLNQSSRRSRGTGLSRSLKRLRHRTPVARTSLTLRVTSTSSCTIAVAANRPSIGGNGFGTCNRPHTPATRASTSRILSAYAVTICSSQRSNPTACDKSRRQCVRCLGESPPGP